MEQLDLQVSLREKLGRRNSKKIRKSGQIPSVVYGKGHSESLAVDATVFEKLLRGRSSIGNMIVSLNFEEKDRKIPCVIQEIQKDPLTEHILHIDFKEISMKDKIDTKIPIVIKGTPVGVQQGGGVMEQHLWDIAIRCFATNLPKNYKIDIESLNVGDFLHISDLPKDENFEITQKAEDLILAVVLPRKSEGNDKVDDAESPKEPEVTAQKSEASDE